MIDTIVRIITAKMENIIEETITRLFKSLQKRVEVIEAMIAANEAELNDDESDSEFESSSEEENPVPKVTDYIKMKQKQMMEANKSAKAATKPTATKTPKSTKEAAKEVVAPPITRAKAAGKNSKRTRSPNSSMESPGAGTNKDPKTTKNVD